MNKHTAGPWRVSESVNRLPEIYGPDDNCVTDRVYNGNAQLIAAAPELLAVLKGIVHHNEALKDQLKLSPSLMRQVEQAISKAEGRSE